MIAARLPVCVSLNAQNEADELRAVERARLRSLVEADVETARRAHADDFQLVDTSGATLLDPAIRWAGANSGPPRAVEIECRRKFSY
jgi:hypothetical protein